MQMGMGYDRPYSTVAAGLTRGIPPKFSRTDARILTVFIFALENSLR
jgi:hypothetical protein